MRYVKAVIVLALAVCALSAASAQAALPEFSGTVPSAGKAKSTKPKFENEGSSLLVECAESEGTLEVKTVKGGTFDELFLGCEAVLNKTKLGKCTGLTDTVTGSILATGSFVLGFELGNLLPVVALSVTTLHFECPLGTLVTVEGCLVGTTTLTKGLTGTLGFEGAAGVQKFLDYTNDAGTMVACKLQSSVNGAAAKPSDQVQTANLTFTKELGVLD